MEAMAATEDGFFEQYYGEHYEDAIPHLVPILSSRLKVTSAVIDESLRALLATKSNGYPLAKDYLETVWILCARHDTLRFGTPIDEFRAIEFAEWVPIVGLDCKCDVQRDVTGYTFTFKCLGGQPATKMFTRFFSGKALGWMRNRMYSLPRTSRADTPVSAAEMVGFRTWVMMSPDEGGQIEFDRVAIDGAVEKYNRTLLKARREACTQGGSLPCAKCHMGLDRCHRAVHKTTYEVKLCKACSVHAPFNLEQNKTVCVACDDRRRMASKLKKRR